MLVSGEIENVPLLDVLQVVAHSKQTGVLTVQGVEMQGALVFERGGIVCGESAATRPLLARAASSKELRSRNALRRVATLAVLTELLALRFGVVSISENARAARSARRSRPAEPIYESGALDAWRAPAARVDRNRQAGGAVAARLPARGGFRERSHPRYGPTLIPASVLLGNETLDGHLTNLSEGGALFNGGTLPAAESLLMVRLTLPGDLGQIACRARVAWVGAHGETGLRGAGLAFIEMTNEARGRLASYLASYQRLADEYLEPKPVRG